MYLWNLILSYDRVEVDGNKFYVSVVFSQTSFASASDSLPISIWYLQHAILAINQDFASFSLKKKTFFSLTENKLF